MRAVVQRVIESRVEVDGKIVGEISKGLLLFLGIGKEDNEKDMDYLINKILGLRIFTDDFGKMNLSLLDIKGELLVVSQFTLYGDARKGRRPSFTNSALPEKAEALYEKFINRSRANGVRVDSGVFGADMKISLINDGPVTILLDSKREF